METKNKGTLEEYWGLRALASCHDTLWPDAERDDVRYMLKNEAEMLMRKNPGRFKHFDVYVYRGGEWRNIAKDTLDLRQCRER